MCIALYKTTAKGAIVTEIHCVLLPATNICTARKTYGITETLQRDTFYFYYIAKSM